MSLLMEHPDNSMGIVSQPFSASSICHKDDNCATPVNGTKGTIMIQSLMMVDKILLQGGRKFFSHMYLKKLNHNTDINIIFIFAFMSEMGGSTMVFL